MRTTLLASGITLALLTPLAALAVNNTQMTQDNGAPVGDNQNSQTAGPNGPTLLQDSHLVQTCRRISSSRQ